MDLDSMNEIRAVIRGELDRKPDKWRVAAEACIAYVRYQALPFDGGTWNATDAERLERIAIARIKEIDNARPE